MSKPIILISKCLGFDKCRYNGDTVKSETVDIIKDYCEFIPVCPESEIGLGVPRNPIRLVKKGKSTALVQPATGNILTDSMNEYSEEFLRTITKIDGIILKGRSPSCGIRDVKYYSEKGIEIDRKHRGIFADAVFEKYKGYPIEDEGGLLNEKLRDHFLTGIFTFAEFRDLQKRSRIADLLNFHAKNKLLFMAYNQKEMRILGNMLGNQGQYSKKELFSSYFESLKKIMEKPITKGNNINTLLHSFGYVSKSMNKKEIEYFLDVLKDYKNNILTISVPIALMKSHISRFEIEYLSSQSYFYHYPIFKFLKQ